MDPPSKCNQGEENGSWLHPNFVFTRATFEFVVVLSAFANKFKIVHFLATLLSRSPILANSDRQSHS